MLRTKYGKKCFLYHNIYSEFCTLFVIYIGLNGGQPTVSIIYPVSLFKDFAFISHKLDKVSVAIDALNLWVNKTASENNINIDMLNIEKEKLDK